MGQHHHDHECNCCHTHDKKCTCSVCVSASSSTSNKDTTTSTQKFSDDSGGEDSEDSHSSKSSDSDCDCDSGCSCSHEHDFTKNSILPLAIRFSISLVIFLSCLILNISSNLKLVLFLLSYLICGYTVLFDAARGIIRGYIFDENFLMSVATIAAFGIGDYSEGTAVMLFFCLGTLFEQLAHGKSKNYISALLDLRSDTANILGEDGKYKKIPPKDVRIGDLIYVFPGESIPLDGIVTAGSSSINQSSVTGESVPRDVFMGDTVYSGCTNLSGALTISVTKDFFNSTATKITKLMENAAAKKSRSEAFITRFSKVYTPVVVAGAVLITLIPYALSGFSDFSLHIHRSLIFLVVSCPCALVLSVPMSYFAGMGAASKNGILIRGSKYLEAFSNIGTVVFDKTGTITTGKFILKDVFLENGFSRDEVLYFASALENLSIHPIARSITSAYFGEIAAAESFEEIPGYGLLANVDGKKVAVGNVHLMQKYNIETTDIKVGGTLIYVAVDGIIAGIIHIGDEIKSTSVLAIRQLNDMGIKTAILTGDNILAANEIAEQTGVREVYSDLVPEQKVSILESILKQRDTFGAIAYVGDGINDAPALKRADVGIAMGGVSSDSAVEAADAVIVNDDLQKIKIAINISNRTKFIVWQNIVMSLFFKALVLTLGVFDLTPLWLAVFADVGVAVLAILNSLRALSSK